MKVKRDRGKEEENKIWREKVQESERKQALMCDQTSEAAKTLAFTLLPKNKMLPAVQTQLNMKRFCRTAAKESD